MSRGDSEKSGWRPVGWAWRGDRADDKSRATVARQRSDGSWRSGQSVSREEEQIRREDRGTHVDVKSRRPFPHAPRQAEDPLPERDPGLDAGANAAELVVDPLAAHHVADPSPRFLAKHTSATPIALASVRLSTEAKAPSKLAWRGGRPYSRCWRRRSGSVHVTSPGVPFGIAQSRMRPERPVVRKILWP